MDDIDEFVAYRERLLREQRLAISARRCQECMHYESIDSRVPEDGPKFRCLVRDDVYDLKDEGMAVTCASWLWYELGLRE